MKFGQFCQFLLGYVALQAQFADAFSE